MSSGGRRSTSGGPPEVDLQRSEVAEDYKRATARSVEYRVFVDQCTSDGFLTNRKVILMVVYDSQN